MRPSFADCLLRTQLGLCDCLWPVVVVVVVVADVLHLFPALARSTATTHLPRHKFIGFAAASHAQTTRHSRRLVIHTGWVKKVSCCRNVEIRVAWGSHGSIYVIGNVTIRSSAYDFLFEFNRNHASILYCFRDTAGYLSKVADFYPPHLHLAPPYGLILVEFRGDFWHQKTRVSGLSCYRVRDVDGSCAKHLTIEFLRSLCCWHLYLLLCVFRHPIIITFRA